MDYLRKYGFGFLVVLAVLFPFAFYSSDLAARSELSFVERSVRVVSVPLQWIMETGRIGATRFFKSYIDLRDARESATLLAEENAQLKIELQMLSDMKTENDHLREQLGLVQRTGLRFRSCEIVSGDPSFLYRSIRIGCGEKSEVFPGMGVLSASGVVGVVMRTSAYAADVLLISDPNSNLDVIVARNRRRGILSGSPSSVMHFKYSDRGSRVHVGDEVITSGLTGPFPGGLAVGRVSRISGGADGAFQTIEVEPTMNIFASSGVLVLLQPSSEVGIIRKIGGEDWMRKIVEGSSSGRAGG